MTDNLGDLLRRGADTVPVPELDLDGLVAEAGRRQRRRRLAVVASAVAAVAAIATGSVLVTHGGPNSQSPPPAAPPSHSSSADVHPEGARPLVYAVGSTVHVGDKTVEAPDAVAFIDATDQGAVYEAAYDGTLRFTDGTTTTVIGTTEFTAAPTAHVGVVTTGDSGSLVVWRDASLGRNRAARTFVVYDTSRRETVARIPFFERDRNAYDVVVYVAEHRVYFNPDPSTPGCWAVDIQDVHPCMHPELFRFDVASGSATRITLADLRAELSTRTRTFVVGAGNDLEIDGRPGLTQVGRRLVATDANGDPTTLHRTSGDDVRLSLPSGFTALGHRGGAGVVSVAQWLDDDHVTVWANGGGGDLPPQQGDLLVCSLPDGSCRVAVPRSSDRYVAP